MRKTSPRKTSGKWLGLAIALPALLTGVAYGQYAQKNVVQPNDPIIASSDKSPATEAVANAIDGTQAKYLNFDMNGNVKTAGFIVTPSVGATWVTGIAIETANDAPERDPADMTLEGSNDASISSFGSGNWVPRHKIFQMFRHMSTRRSYYILLGAARIGNDRVRLEVGSYLPHDLVSLPDRDSEEHQARVFQC